MGEDVNNVLGTGDIKVPRLGEDFACLGSNLRRSSSCLKDETVLGNCIKDNIKASRHPKVDSDLPE